ncbi:rRNA maturation RNase YbeY [Puniceibacterium sp. IMCC21224]|uniref:rRNA maturation RNase YbeY n=1 Tax=Puniceibacterium sp. IMCC21224 TaxID=1618204 RepID=UPI00064DB804|nr:rRNA maturation RNase YbeY [Puniceibacterium sp. IMCC21224]KMK68901.1 putative rRNA maturation factor YbeY [Puniceibacterium sp. IMCC21224]
MLTDTIIDAKAWAVCDIESLAETAAAAALVHLKLDPVGYEIAVLACDDARIAVLNADFRGKPVPTNVLSWPSFDLGSDVAGDTPAAPPAGANDDPEALGDIAIALETCAKEAEEAGKPLTDHVTHLIVHGVLHLLGYDHIRDPDATLMEGLEATILGKLGLPDPYTTDGA